MIFLWRLRWPSPPRVDDEREGQQVAQQDQRKRGSGGHPLAHRALENDDQEDGKKKLAGATERHGPVDGAGALAAMALMIASCRIAAVVRGSPLHLGGQCAQRGDVRIDAMRLVPLARFSSDDARIEGRSVERVETAA